jgi:hypothetical protein
MKKIVALSAILGLLFLLPARPAEAQVTSVDRSAIVLTYQPVAASSSLFSFALSYRFNPTWDLLASSSSFTPTGAGAPADTVTRYGVRYHLRAPRAGSDLYVILQAASETAPAASPFLVGAGFSAPVASNVDLYGTFTYDSVDQNITYDIGVQYPLQRQMGLVLGFNGTLGYLGLSYRFR